MISKTAIIYPNVKLGRDCVVEDFVILGAPPRGYREGELETVIGDYAVIRSQTVIYGGNTIGDHFQTGNKANIRELNTIGNNVSIGTLSVVEHHVTIADNARVHTQVFIPEYTVLEEGAWVGPNVVFTNAKYPNTPSTKDELKGAIVCRSAIVGANSTILPGIEIGEGALVGAGSVVVKHVAPGTVVAGNPAVPIKSTADISQYASGK